MKLSDMKIDSAAIEAGVWVRDIPGMGDLAVKVRGLRNADYRRLNASLWGAVPAAKKGDPAEADRIAVTLLAETILIGWDGLTDDDGTPLPWSTERAVALLSDPDFALFRDAVTWAASTVGDISREAVEDSAKN